MTPTDLRTLAARVLGEKPTFALESEIRAAVEPDGPTVPRRYLTSHDAAFAAMPAGWMLVISTAPGKNCTVDAAWDYGDGPEPDPENWRTVHAEAPTLPRAVTAAGLLARAAEMEAT